MHKVLSPSPSSTAWPRISRGAAQWARQPSKFAPEIEGMDTVFVNGGTAVAQAQPEDLDLCTGRPIACHFEITPPPPPDRWYPGQRAAARLGPREIHIGERRW